MGAFSQLRKFPTKMIALGNGFSHFLLLAVRLFWGYGFLQAGMGKFADLERTIKFFEGLGIPFPGFAVPFVGVVEGVGGLLLLIGLASRIAAFPLVITMVVAYLTAHFDAVAQIVQNPDQFIAQSPFLFLLASCMVFCFGPGRFSVDALFGKLLKWRF